MKLKIFAGRLIEDLEREQSKLLDELIIELNNPLGVNMNISYSYLMGCDIYRIKELIQTVEESIKRRGDVLGKENGFDYESTRSHR